MFLLSKQLQDLKVISLQTGQPVAVTKQAIVDPSRLQVVALHCQLPEKAQVPVIMSQDIRQVAKDCILIDSADHIGESGEIVRLNSILESRFRLVGLPVVSESGHKVGKVEEFTFGVEDFYIKKLYIKQPLLKSLLSSNLIIDRSQIIDVDAQKVTVNDTWIKNPLLAPQAKPVK